MITAITIKNQTQKISWANVAKIKLKKLTDTQIRKYIELDQPFDCAGAYKIESFGIQLIESVEATDFTAIQGLPLIELAKNLKTLGIEIP